MYRAAETDRRMPLFRDPFARRLAGERGEAMAATMRHQDKTRALEGERPWSGIRLLERQSS